MRNEYSHNILIHSRGPWKKHKYLKKIGNKYFYANSKSGGKSKSSKDDEEYRDVTNEQKYDTFTEAMEAKKRGDKYFERNVDKWLSTSYKLTVHGVDASYNYKDVGKIERTTRKAKKFLSKKFGFDTPVYINGKRVK